jgi:hypothetical protein
LTENDLPLYLQTGLDLSPPRCKAGHYYTDGNECQLCPKGTYSAYGDTGCKVCPGGQYTKNHISCNDCPKGTYSDSRADECIPCAAGTVAMTTKSTKCIACKDGEFSTRKNTICDLCAPGTYSNKPTNSCAKCPTSTYSGYGETKCTKCVPGQYYDPKYHRCINCRPGEYSTSPLKQCQRCPYGSYSTVLSSTECKYCAPGQVVDTPSRTFCTDCKASFYAPPIRVVKDNTLRELPCQKCKPGTYSEPKWAKCKTCPAGQKVNAEQTGCDRLTVMEATLTSE